MIDNFKLMEMRRLVYLFVATTLLFCSCDKFPNTQQPITADGLTLSQENVEMYPGGGSVQILLTSASSWSLTNVNNNWVTVTDVNGVGLYNGKPGSTVLVLSADVNQTDSNLFALLRFNSAGVQKDLIITQDVPYLRVKHGGSWLGAEFDKSYMWYVSENKPDSEHVFRIESNTWWKITGAEEEFIFNQTEGEGDFNLTVLPRDINVSEEDHVMHITLEGPDERNKYEMEFVQDYLIFILHNNNLTGCDEFGIEIPDIVVESEVDWHVTENRDGWSVLGRDYGYGTSGSPIKTQLGTLTIHPNETRIRKNHKIEFIPEDPDALSRGVTIPYEIVQDPFVFDVDGNPEPSYTFANRDAASEAKHLIVNSSVDWYVHQSPSWLSLNKDSMAGVGNPGGAESKLTFAPNGQNMELAQRAGTIILKNDFNKLQVPISVTQDEFLFTTDWNGSTKLEAVPENERVEYHSFNFKTSGPWYIDSCPEWLYFPVQEGAYNDDQGINLYFKAKSINSAEADRTAQVRLVSELHENMGNPVYKTLSVTQKGFKFYLGNSEGPEDDVLNEFSELGKETQKIDVTSPTEWKANPSHSWILVNPREGIAGAEVTVSVYMNTSMSSRSGKITFINNDVNDGKGKSIDVVVSQAPYKFSVDFGVGTSLNLGPILDHDNSSYTVNVTSSGRWKVESDVGWVTFSSNGASKGDTFDIKVGNNLTPSKRTANVVVTNMDLPYDNIATLKITQEGFVFKAECKDKIEFDALSGGQSYNITYTCSAGLKIDAPSWVNCDVRGDGTIVVTADDNINTINRTGNIKLSNSYTSDSRTFSVTQDPYEFAVSGSSYSLDHANNGDIIIQITSSGGWTALSDVAWLTVKPASGNGNAQIAIAVDDNTKAESRKGVVTVKSEDNLDLEHQITFTQDAAPKKK